MNIPQWDTHEADRGKNKRTPCPENTPKMTPEMDIHHRNGWIFKILGRIEQNHWSLAREEFFIKIPMNKSIAYAYPFYLFFNCLFTIVKYLRKPV